MHVYTHTHIPTRTLSLYPTVLSIPYYHAVHFSKLWFPNTLACDYSDVSVPLATSALSIEFAYTCAVYAFVLIFLPLRIASADGQLPGRQAAAALCWVMVCVCVCVSEAPSRAVCIYVSLSLSTKTC